MKKQNLYNVTVYATLSKDVLVYAENEDAALNYVQDVCDNTDLISFERQGDPGRHRRGG